jgi:hypothetical protein
MTFMKNCKTFPQSYGDQENVRLTGSYPAKEILYKNKVTNEMKKVNRKVKKEMRKCIKARRTKNT